MALPASSIAIQGSKIKDPKAASSPMDPLAFTSEGTLDLDDTSSELTRKWSVADSARLSVQGVLKSGSWAAASVLVRGSIDGVKWTTITTLTSATFSPALDVAPYSFVDIKVSVAEGSAGTAEFHGYATTPPF